MLGIIVRRSRSAAWLILVCLLQAIGLPGAERHGPNEYRLYAAEHPGLAERGEKVFQDEQRTACVKCHSVDGTGSKAGPDLSGIGDKYQRTDLIRSVLEPSATIAIGYGTTILETKGGEEYQGVVKQATSGWLELMGGDGRSVRVEVTEIQAQRSSDVSLMPEGLESSLSLEEFADLIAYLESRRGAASLSATVGTAMADSIPLATRGLELVPFFGNEVKLNHPVWFEEIPGLQNTYVVLEHGGKSWVIEKAPAERQHLLVDLSNVVRVGGATGLLGLAFHPNFSLNHKYYLKYHVIEHGMISTVVVERQFDPKLLADSGAVSRQLLKVAAVTQDHNGGCLRFGPDGFLYIGMGDSGPQRDPQGHGQDLSILLGKILRIDVDHPQSPLPYGIPANNPFVRQAGARAEIWAYGFREPWRYSFDRLNGNLWVGDVGQDQFEEVSIVRLGENLGWNVYEGWTPFSNRYRKDGTQYVMPIFSYSHREGVSVTGGYVYRGKRAPQMFGRYIFADFETRRIWALTETNRVLSSLIEIGRAPTRAVSFGEDSEGELYLVGYDEGVVYRMEMDMVDPKPLTRLVALATSEREPTSWRYTLAAPAPGWYEEQFEDSSWSQGIGGFGTRGTPGAVVRTEWNTSDIWLRREFLFKHEKDFADAEKIALRLHHDEDVDVYLNGVLATHLPRWTTGYVEVPLSKEAREKLHEGKNLLAIHCHQNSGGQYIDAGIVLYLAKGAQ